MIFVLELKKKKRRSYNEILAHMVAATGDIITHLTESSFSPIAAPLERQKPSSSVEYEINL